SRSNTAIYPLSLHDALPICFIIHRIRNNSRLSVQNIIYEPSRSVNRRKISVFVQIIRICSILLSQIIQTVIRRPIYVEIITSIRSEEHTSELQSRENLVCRL